VSDTTTLMDRLRTALTGEERRRKLQLTAEELDKRGIERKGLDLPQTLSVSKELAAAMVGARKMTEDDVAEMVEGLTEAMMATMDEKGYATDDNRDDMRKAVLDVTERMLGQMRDDAEMMADDEMAGDDDAKMADDEMARSLKAMGAQLDELGTAVKAMDELGTAVVTMAEGFAAFVDAQSEQAATTKQLRDDLDTVLAQLRQTPRQASKTTETVVTDDDTALAPASSAAKVQEMIDKYGYDPTRP